MDMVTIFKTFNPAEAQMIHSRLTAAGFAAEITDEMSAMNFNVASGGTRLQVPEFQAEEARAFLDSGENQPAEDLPA